MGLLCESLSWRHLAGLIFPFFDFPPSFVSCMSVTCRMQLPCGFWVFCRLIVIFFELEAQFVRLWVLEPGLFLLCSYTSCCLILLFLFIFLLAFFSCLFLHILFWNLFIVFSICCYCLLFDGFCLFGEVIQYLGV